MEGGGRSIAWAADRWEIGGAEVLAVRAHDLWFAYRKGRWVLQGVGMEVPQRAIFAIMGPSGAGKPTLLRVLAGLLRPQRGEVCILGNDVHNGAPKDLRRRLGYIPQQLGLVRSMTALDNVLMGALGRLAGPGPLLGLFPKAEVERAHELLVALGIGHKAREKVFRLSGGERQRVAIARALMQDPLVVFADELVSDLDLPLAAEVMGRMRELAASLGITFVMNMHELPLVREYCHWALIMRGGQVLFQGRAEAVTWELLQEALS